MRKLIEKTLSICFSLFLFSFLATGIHEQFHYLAGKAQGVEGYVSYSAFGGTYHYITQPALYEDVLIGLSGGIGTGLVFLFLWYLAHSQTKYTNWELDDSLALLVVTLTQFIYAPFDAIGRTWAYWAGQIGMGIAFTVSILIYGKRLISWIGED